MGAPEAVARLCTVITEDFPATGGVIVIHLAQESTEEGRFARRWLPPCSLSGSLKCPMKTTQMRRINL